MSRCRGCGAEVVWITTTAGKKMICEAKQITATGALLGLVLVTDNGVVMRNPIIGSIGREPHWGRCPKAKEFKKK